MSGRPKSRSMTPLARVLPFLRPYRWRILAGFLALICSSTATLVLPFFARGLIDQQFVARQAGQVGHYFPIFVAAAAVLGLSSATRFYFVTWLGERVTADLRKAVFDNVLRLTPAFFEVTRTGEVLSRLTADTTLVQTVIGSSASVALRNLVTLTGGLALMFFTSLKLTSLVLGAVVAIMLPLILFGRWVRRLSRASQDRIADIQRPRQPTLNAVQTVQAFTQEGEEGVAFSGTVERSFETAIVRTRARALMTAVVIFTFFSALASVLYIGAQDGVVGHRMTAGTLVQFIILGGIVAGGFGSLSEVWGDLQRAAGASERLMELLHTKPAIAPPAHPKILAGTCPRRRPIPQCQLSLSVAPGQRGAEGIFTFHRFGRSSGAGGTIGCGQNHCLRAFAALLCCPAGKYPVRWRGYRRSRSGGAAPSYRGGGAGPGDFLRQHRRQYRLWPGRRHAG